jgi:uncharacterized phage protein (TIGR01671 family)
MSRDAITPSRFRFRAYHPEWEEIVLCDMSDFEFDKREIVFKFEVGFSNYPQDDRWIFMQSTGLLDANGVEIFEGDVVNLDFDTEIINAVVEHQDCGFYAVDPLTTIPLCGPICDAYRIVGNRYQNPELLEAADA